MQTRRFRDSIAAFPARASDRRGRDARGDFGMPVVVTCACGKKLKARDDQAGRRFRCPGCGGEVVAPSPVVAAPILVPSSFKPVTYGGARPRAVLAPPDPDVQRAESSWRGQLHWLLVLCMLPLLWMTVVSAEDKLRERVRDTLAKHPEVAAKIDAEVEAELEARQAEEEEFTGRRHPITNEQRDALLLDSIDEVVEQLPGERLDGALHARSTWWHWLYALGALGLYFTFLVFVLPGLPAQPLHLLYVGLFTGTLGVLFLLCVQFFGFCCVGPWYAAALNPNAPVGARLLGFLFGVGFCEEIVKMLPVLWRIYRPAPIGWREACVWGMASGAGFGISEGIHYCSSYYNGIFGVDIYVLRFASVVTLHVVLSGACAIMLQRHQHLLDEGRDIGDWLLTLTAILLVPMLLHALYNTFSDEGILGGAIAIIIAAASVAWLGHLIAQSRRRELVPPGSSEFPGAPVMERTARGMRVVKP
jgi:RsiW-degrading membrane proteinase PrsW (M82 family)